MGSQKSVSYGPQEAGINRLHTYTLSRGKIFITNNVPYILLLDDGRSSQAQPGFIARTIENTVADFEAVI